MSALHELALEGSPLDILDHASVCWAARGLGISPPGLRGESFEALCRVCTMRHPPRSTIPSALSDQITRYSIANATHSHTFSGQLFGDASCTNFTDALRDRITAFILGAHCIGQPHTPVLLFSCLDLGRNQFPSRMNLVVCTSLALIAVDITIVTQIRAIASELKGVIGDGC